MIAYLKQIRKNILVYLTHSVALPLLKLYRKNRPFPYAEATLRALSAGTVGHDLITVLDNEHHRLLPYYEKHDIKHVVLGYPMTEEGEVDMQFFMLGNGHISFPVLATVLMGLFTMPEYYPSLRRAFAKGRASNKLKSIDWFQLIECNTIQVQQRFFTCTPTT